MIFMRNPPVCPKTVANVIAVFVAPVVPCPAAKENAARFFRAALG
jgi:hypothetical protein